MVVRAVLVDRELCTVLLLLLASFPPGGAQRPPSFRAATTEHTLLPTARSKQCRAGGNCDTGVCSSTGRCTCAVLMGGERAAGRCRAVTRGWCLPPLRQLKSARAALLFELAAVAEGSKSSSAAAWMSRLFASAPHSLSTQQMAHFSLHSANELALGMMGTQRGSHPPLPRDDLPSYIDFSSCAVVGSSNSLLASQHGSAIDAHTAVIRFNQAPTAGYESHVGSRTTLRIQNSFAAGEVEGARSEVCLIRLSSSKKKNKDGARLGQLSGDGSGHGCGSVVQLSPQFEAYRRMLWYNMSAAGGSKWSSGFMGIALAVNLCASVSLYGFDFGSGYYFPKEHRKKDNKGVAAGHPWALERNCTRALAQLPSVTLHGR